MKPMTPDLWLEAHPYLSSVADFDTQVATAAAGIPSGNVNIPNWQDYIDDYQVGIPLLRSSHIAIDMEPAGAILVSLLENLAPKPMPERLAGECRVLRTRNCGASPRCSRRIGRLVTPGRPRRSNQRIPRPACATQAWTATAQFLSPLVDRFGSWREEERWLRGYCPTCGSPPAMSQLVGVEPGRLRLLSCGCCNTRWRYRRIGCPFCESANDHRLSALAIEGEKYLRIDYCQLCRAYLKTYDGEGSETFFLADWTSLHLDIIARDRGLKRLANSLYEM